MEIAFFGEKKGKPCKKRDIDSLIKKVNKWYEENNPNKQKK